MTADDIFAEITESVGRYGLDLTVERDPIGRIVVGDHLRTWRVILQPGPLPLDITIEGVLPPSNERLDQGFWAVVKRLTAPADPLSFADRSELQRMKDGLDDGLKDRQGERS